MSDGDYKGIPLFNLGVDVLAGHDEGDLFVVDRAAIRSFTLVEPKWELPADYRTRDRQLAIYQEFIGGALFGRSEPAWVALKRRAREAEHRAINSRNPFGRRWWRDLRDSIVLGFKADWMKTVHPERRVPTRSAGMITGLS